MRNDIGTLVLVCACLVLAGCSDGGGKPQDDLPPVKATEDTGVIRGVVVDAAIQPVADASVTVSGNGIEDTIATAADGFFGFQGLVPGDYVVTASKLGFITAKTATTVVAAKDDPPAVKLLLEPDPEATLSVATFKFDGFIECSESFILAGHATCQTVPGSNDHFMEEYQLDGVPDWTQSEMVWSSTQSVSTELALLYSRSVPDQVLLDNWEEAEGASPQVITVNRTRAEEVGLGTNITLMLRVFNQHNDGTAPQDHLADPVDGDDCWDRPVLGGCLRGLGFTVQQEFTVFTHAFYGFVPDEGWRFHVDGAHPLPQR